MFHLQLRQFPHNHCQFNLSDADLRSFMELWVRGEWLVVGEREWSPRRAKLTVIEAPRVATAQLAMGRGWRHVERSGQDVTRRVLSGATAPMHDRGGGSVASIVDAAPAPREPGADASDLEALLGEGSRARELLEAWRSTASRFPDRSPSECLTLAERELDSPEPSR